MVQRKHTIKNHFEELEKYLKDSILSGKAKKLIEIGGMVTKLPKKIHHGVEESYRKFKRKFKQAK